jgi:hypothetical protein
MLMPANKINRSKTACFFVNKRAVYRMNKTLICLYCVSAKIYGQFGIVFYVRKEASVGETSFLQKQKLLPDIQKFIGGETLLSVRAGMDV